MTWESPPAQQREAWQCAVGRDFIVYGCATSMATSIAGSSHAASHMQAGLACRSPPAEKQEKDGHEKERVDEEGQRRGTC